jgi:hypothetical protein
MSPPRPLPLFSLGLLLLLSGCCETRGEVTCSRDGVAVEDAVLAGALAESCGWGTHYPADGSRSRLVLSMATQDEALRLRVELQGGSSFSETSYPLPVPGQGNAQVPSFELRLSAGTAALVSGEVRLPAYDLREATSQRGVVALAFADGVQCEVDFQLCHDAGLDIGEPPPRPDDDHHHDIDWDD